jgi:alcohol dehydrogenase class IV
MSTINTYNFPTSIHAGPGARQRLPEMLKAAGVKKPLIVTDKALAELEPVKNVAAILKAAGLEAQVYSGIWGNPVKSQVTGGVDAYKQGKRDSIVALGGGAALDVAKAIALMIHHPGDLFDYIDGDPNAKPIDRDIPWIAALPTTAGTGSEVGRSAVVSDDTTHVKKIIFSPRLLAKVVLADPELTLKLPAKVTAATGMDALTHLVESYIAKGWHPLCEGIALEGIRLVSQSLERAVRFARGEKVGSDADHLAARNDMLHAAMMGAVAFQKGLGVTHSCAHALSTVCDLHHGLANGIMITAAMRFNLAVCGDKFARMAVMAGLEDPTPEAFIHWLETLRAAIGLPASLKTEGVKREQLERLVELAYEDPCHQNNPREVGRDDLHAIFEASFG